MPLPTGIVESSISLTVGGIYLNLGLVTTSSRNTDCLILATAIIVQMLQCITHTSNLCTLESNLQSSSCNMLLQQPFHHLDIFPFAFACPVQDSFTIFVHHFRTYSMLNIFKDCYFSHPGTSVIACKSDSWYKVVVFIFASICV